MGAQVIGIFDVGLNIQNDLLNTRINLLCILKLFKNKFVLLVAARIVANAGIKADIAYAERIGEQAEMSIMIDAPRSFSSDLNTILQLGVTLAPYAISAVSLIISELIKNKKKIKIKVTDDSIEIEGDEDKALDVVRELIKQKKEDQAQKILNDLLAGNKLV